MWWWSIVLNICCIADNIGASITGLPLDVLGFVDDWVCVLLVPEELFVSRLTWDGCCCCCCCGGWWMFSSEGLMAPPINWFCATFCVEVGVPPANKIWFETMFGMPLRTCVKLLPSGDERPGMTPFCVYCWVFKIVPTVGCGLELLPDVLDLLPVLGILPGWMPGFPERNIFLVNSLQKLNQRNENYVPLVMKFEERFGLCMLPMSEWDKSIVGSCNPFIVIPLTKLTAAMKKVTQKFISLFD